MTSKSGRVAVIGLGAYGIVTVNNMLEVGFDVVAYDRNEYIGGLWTVTTDPGKTSVLPTTISNQSKQRKSFTDFPFPDDVPDFPTSAQVQKYLEDYADHFQLRPAFRLGTTVTGIDRSEKGEKWIVSIIKPDSNATEEEFDKVIITNGTFHSPVMPEVPGIENFGGEVIHSQSFKDPNDFSGKNVVVVGLSNSAADTAVELSKVAANVFLSHRSGACVLPRKNAQGKPSDHTETIAMSRLVGLLKSISLRLTKFFYTRAIEKSMHAAYPTIDPSWNLLPAPPPTHNIPIINDHLISLLADESIYSLPGIASIPSPHTLTLSDGTNLPNIDAIIFCTGYRATFSILPPSLDPTAHSTPEYDAAPFGSSVRRHARLYQGIFSPAYPDSLAFIGPYIIISAFTGADVVSQAIGQVFSGGYPLPPQTEIERSCDEHYAYCLAMAHIARAPAGLVKNGEVGQWLNEACGNGLNEMLGWGWEAWKFWWRERELYRLVVGGVNTGFLYRLFEGRRRSWDGAREAIYRANGREWGGKKGDAGDVV
ncbi:hypothetical protein V502_00651 [Pseudogymnoascus sp. VKM F-4520 (FW-2644)]|nr:hypothetical protein V502_00651 [Pseudogymnoascus sp. VKM F-4520 (FW-2644)]